MRSMTIANTSSYDIDAALAIHSTFASIYPITSTIQLSN